MSYAHKPEHADLLLSAYLDFFQLVKDCREKGSVKAHLEGKVLEPLFKLR